LILEQRIKKWVQMDKRKDKVRIKSTERNLKNVHIDDVDDFLDYDYSHEKKAVSRGQNRNKKTLKRDVNLEDGLITEIMTNNMFKVRLNGQEVTALLGGRLKQFMFNQRRVMAIGDKVKIDTSQGSPYRIEELIDRKNKLMRYSEGSYQKEILIASNMDYAIITVSCVQPMLKLGIIDRFIIQCGIDNIEPVICVNKIDLVDDVEYYQEMLAYYIESGYKSFFVSAESGQGIDKLKDFLRDKISVFSGQSGVGKSSVINALMPSLDLKVGQISNYNEKGRHTTTNSKLLEWDFGGFIVDTPGIKTLALKRDNVSLVYNNFPGFDRYACYFNNCSHTHEDNCGVLDALARGEIPQKVYESYLRIIESVNYE
jgi:ribosome biogenesis GTPase